MNILFPTISSAIQNISNRGIYPDLVRKLLAEGHRVYVVYPLRKNDKLKLEKVDSLHMLGIPFTKITKASLPERVWAMLRISSVFRSKINFFFPDVVFDVVLYATPPITFNGLLSKIKAEHNAFCFLMLKDIFPQNAVDLGMMSKSGLLFKLFRKQEERLYHLSDYIGCMSPANVKYIIENSAIDLSSKVGICSNGIEIRNKPLTDELKLKQKSKWNLPLDKTLIIYGGNLGKPQGLSFLREILYHYKDDLQKHFVISGGGTEAKDLEKWIFNHQLVNVTFYNQMDRRKYDELESAADLGLVFLDSRFTIPNFPSRMLSYMEHGLPILFSVDDATDAATIAEENGFGFRVKHGDSDNFIATLNSLTSSKTMLAGMGKKGRVFLEQNFTVEQVYQSIWAVLKKTNDKLAQDNI